jgi:hypothetical protein
MLCSSTVFDYCVRILCSSTVFKYCVQVLCLNTVFKFCVQVLCSSTVFEYCVQVLCSNTVFKYCVQILCSSTVFKNCGVYMSTHPKEVLNSVTEHARVCTDLWCWSTCGGVDLWCWPVVGVDHLWCWSTCGQCWPPVVLTTCGVDLWLVLTTCGVDLWLVLTTCGVDLWLVLTCGVGRLVVGVGLCCWSTCGVDLHQTVVITCSHLHIHSWVLTCTDLSCWPAFARLPCWTARQQKGKTKNLQAVKPLPTLIKEKEPLWYKAPKTPPPKK